MGRIKRHRSKTEIDALVDAISNLGGELAASIAIGNISKAAVQKWHISGVPAERCADLERLSGVPKGLLRPDLFELPA